MIDYLTHYYKAGSTPFKSLSTLSKKDAIDKMNKMYVDDPMWGRFKNPDWYLQERKKTERWLRKMFVSKGGKLLEEHPIYMVFGECKEIENNKNNVEIAKIQVPLSEFTVDDISFTYIDSMFSYSLAQTKSPEFYQADYHGKVFLLSEIQSLLEERGLPKKGWWGNLPSDFFPYIEAQVWDTSILKKYR